MEDFFKVEVKQKNQHGIPERKHLKASFRDKLLYGTVASKLLFLCFCCRKRKEKMLRRLKILEKADHNLKRSLDVRTLLKLQSLVKSLIKVNFEKRHFPLLKEQTSMRVIAKVDSSDNLSLISSLSDASLFDESTSDYPSE